MSEVVRLANSRTSECSASVSLDLKQRWSNLGGPQVVYLCLKLKAEGWVEAGWTGPASKLRSGSAGQRVSGSARSVRIARSSSIGASGKAGLLRMQVADPLGQALSYDDGRAHDLVPGSERGHEVQGPVRQEP